MKKTVLIAAILFDAAVVVYLAGSFRAAVVFLIFIAAFLLPACLLVLRLPPLRAMPAGLRLVAAAVMVVMLAVPWFFVRKLAPFSPGIVDVLVCAMLVGAAAKFGALGATIEELRPAMERSRFPVLIGLPLLFALTWLGYSVPSGREVLFHGLFAIDFGNLVSVVATLRASPLLPLSAITDGGPLYYHWLYFTLPATLADFCGAAIPASNALILVNLVVASLLIHTMTSVVCMLYPQSNRGTALVVAAIALFASFTSYYYQAISSRLSLGWLAMPVRNHLILSPVNSMIIFGNNTFALVLVLFMVMEMERWNRERRLASVVFGTAALSMIIGYSATLLFPVAAALIVWLVLGRVARPLVVLSWAVATGGASVAMFVALRVLGAGSSRHLAFAFDRGQFLRMAVLGMLPLWGLLLLGGRKPLSFFHVLIAAAVATPSFLYITGSPTGQVDFSMKTGSLLAIAFGPLIAATIEPWFQGGVPRWRMMVAAVLVILGAVQTAAYVLQFAYYRLSGVRSRGAVAVPLDYYRSLLWLRDNTPRSSIVVDSGSLMVSDALPTLWIAERRGWLPTPATAPYLIPNPDSSVPRRTAQWAAFLRDPGNGAVSMGIAREADFLLVPRTLASSLWPSTRRFGPWVIYRSVVRR